MKKRRLNPNLVKINRNYTFEDVANDLGVHKNTVASWAANGLHCLKDKRPYLILGSDLKCYLQKKRKEKKQKCKPNELYCLRCKAPTIPAENFVEYQPISSTKGRLEGFCSRCECVVNKFVSIRCLQGYEEIFDLTKPKELEHINDSNNPLLNSDFK